MVIDTNMVIWTFAIIALFIFGMIAAGFITVEFLQLLKRRMTGTRKPTDDNTAQVP